MTFDDFKAAVSARFPGMDFEFDSATVRAGTNYYATHERCIITLFVGSGNVPDEWHVGVRQSMGDLGDTLDAAIDAHQLRLQLITTNAQAMGLL